MRPGASSVGLQGGGGPRPSGAPHVDTLPPGTTVGPYELVEALGSGAMGTVYRARQGSVDVALKIVHPFLLHNEVVLERFSREARVGMSVRHPNVVRTMDVGVAQVGEHALHYLAMAYERGRTLRAALTQLGRVPEALCRIVANGVASGLAAIHAQGVLHRDLKPENLLITENHEVRIMDLGVARLQQEAIKLTQTGALVGSLHYAAPEQLLGDGELDERADLHSLGVTLYELATGVHPYGEGEFAVILRRILRDEPRRAGEVNPLLSPFFEDVIHGLLAKERDDRFGSAAELCLLLDEGERSEWWRARARVAKPQQTQSIRRLRGRRGQPLRGRSEELGALERLYAEVVQGVGRIVELRGALGAGKSRLVSEFLLRLDERGESFHLLSSTYPPEGTVAEPAGVLEAFREHLGSECLESALGEFVTADVDHVRALAQRLRGDSVHQRLSSSALESALVQIVLRLSEERPTILVVDDFQMASEQERELVAGLARATRDSRLLIVVAADGRLAREWLAEVEQLVRFECVTLPPLTAECVQAMIEDGLGDSSPSREVSTQIARSLGGNPLLVGEVVGELRAGRARDEDVSDTWGRTGGVLATASGSSVLDLFHGRLQSLDPKDRHLLTVAACCGFRFDPLLVGDAVGLRPLEVLERLAWIEHEHAIVRSQGADYVFDHPRAHEVLYRRAHPMVRSECHSVVAAVLESRYRADAGEAGEIPGGLAHRLCRHFLAARASKKVREFLRPALDHLERAHMHAAMVELAQAALSEPGLLTGEIQLQTVLRKVGGLRLLGLQEDERRALDDALELADASGDALARARVRRDLGVLLRESGQPGAARLVLSEAVDLAALSGDREEEAWITIALGDVLLSTGRHHDAGELFERALELATLAGSLHVEAAAVGALGHVHFAAGDYGAAVGRFERQLMLARALSVGPEIAEAWLALVRPRALLGDTEGAAAALDAADRTASEHGYGSLRPAILVQAGRLAADRGETGQARVQCMEALEEARRTAAPRIITAALLTLGRLDLVDGDTAGAQARLEEAQQLGRALDEPNEIVLAAALASLLPGGDPAEAARVFEEHEFRLGRRQRMHARLLLWQSTGNGAHLSEAHRLLRGVLAKLPADQRSRAELVVPLFRDILEIWSEKRPQGTA